MKRKYLYAMAAFAALLLTAGGLYAVYYDVTGTNILMRGFMDIPEQANTPGDPSADVGRLYVEDSGGTTTLYFVDSASATTDLLATGSTAFDDIGDPDANGAVDFTDYYQTYDFGDTDADMFTLWFTGAFGDVSGVLLEQKTGNPTNGTLFEIKLADTDPDFISLDQGGTEKVNIASDGSITLSAGSLTLSHATGGDLTVGDDAVVTGDLTVNGATTLAGAFYQSAVAPSSGNLTVNAAGAGTVSIGNSSTGAIALTGGGVDIGDGVADTLTITGVIDADVTLDDGTTDSPKMIFKDSDDEQAEIYQDQSTDDLNVECHDASDSLAVTVGNLSAGTPAADGITLNGDDLFVADDAEIDGTLLADGGIELANGATIDGATANVIEWNENTEEIKWTFASNDLGIVSTSGVVELSFFDNAADAKLTHAADGGADDFYISQTGAQDASLIIDSAGTGADALQIATSAGGIDITVAGGAAGEDIDLTADTSINLVSTEAVADQIKLDAQGTVAGYGVVAETTDGGIHINADGADNGDINIDAADVLTLTTPDPIIVEGGTASVVFEGASADAFELTMAVADPTTDKTLTLADLPADGAVRCVVQQGYTQTTVTDATADVTGSSLTLADGFFTEGATLHFTVGGTVTGANAAVSVILYFEDAAVMTLATTDGAAGDWVAEFTIVSRAAALQRIVGKLIAEGGAELKCDYATDTTDTGAAGTIPVKLQIVSANAGDTITSEYVLVEFWNKSD